MIANQFFLTGKTMFLKLCLQSFVDWFMILLPSKTSYQVFLPYLMLLLRGHMIQLYQYKTLTLVLVKKHNAHINVALRMIYRSWKIHWNFAKEKDGIKKMQHDFVKHVAWYRYEGYPIFYQNRLEYLIIFHHQNYNSGIFDTQMNDTISHQVQEVIQQYSIWALPICFSWMCVFFSLAVARVQTEIINQR